MKVTQPSILSAKVITHSPEDNFKQALKRNYRSLCEFKVEGVPTNLDLLKNILSNSKFKNNELPYKLYRSEYRKPFVCR